MKSLMVLSVNNYAYFKMINFVVQLIALIYENNSAVNRTLLPVL